METLIAVWGNWGLRGGREKYSGQGQRCSSREMGEVGDEVARMSSGIRCDPAKALQRPASSSLFR